MMKPNFPRLGDSLLKLVYHVIVVACLRSLTTETTGKLDVLGLDGDTLGVDGAQVGVLKERDEVSFN